MQFIINKNLIDSQKTVFLTENETLSGVKKIAEKVCNDFSLVFSSRPSLITYDNKKNNDYLPIIAVTEGIGNLFNLLGKNQYFDSSKILGKNEVFSITVTGPVDLSSEEGFDNFKFDSSIIIAGSDKRGTIYGLFKLSEILGVSPFVDWLDIKPSKKDSFSFEEGLYFVSKEPSVRFRGFFINDEWPAFGNFCNKNYGGFNAAVYEHVFELLLRLKGNYLWPAMWSAIFPNDGPGLQNAVLADELGVIMGASHHEPCCRQGEEYKYLRGKDSIYGDAWNFITNEEGITRFWEDGLKRSGKFENVITVGMRGEADTAILGRNATLKDNIDLLRNVLRTQNSLIKKYVNEDLDKVPRMLALYKEVEPYFYGDDEYQGLMGDPELEGVTLMLCDDNYGNLRTVPTEEMRSHKGGYGMYYHFDYHGLPISFEWFNTSFLPKVWEQMTTAYDSGIRDLWIVNVGDIFSTEYPLAFFLDLAYDFDKWGTANKNSASEYTRFFVDKHFTYLTDAQKEMTFSLLEGYTKITGKRRTEAMNDRIYAPFAYNECDELLDLIDKLITNADTLYHSLNDDVSFGFYELVYLPLTANLNIQKMWLLTTLNHAYSSFGSTYALSLIDSVNECIKKDRALVEELHTIHNGKWYGMGLSEHIGFVNWCEEECRYPVIHSFEPANKKRLIVSIPGTNQHTEGLSWTGRHLTMGAFLNPEINEGYIALSVSCKDTVSFTIENESSFLTLSETEGEVGFGELKYIRISLDRNKYVDSDNISTVKIISGEAKIVIRIPINTSSSLNLQNYEANTFVWCGESNVDMGQTVVAMPSYSRVHPEGITGYGYISMEAEHFCKKTDSSEAGFVAIPDYGKTVSAIKAYPQNESFDDYDKSPCISYRFTVPVKGDYIISFYTNPSNPAGRLPNLFFNISVNNGDKKTINAIPDNFAVGDGNMHWQKGVLDNIRITEIMCELEAGLNTLDIFALSPGFVLEKTVIYPNGRKPADSYLGPKETFYTKNNL